MSESENSQTRSGLMPSQPVRWGIPAAAIGLILSEAAIVASHLLRRLPDFARTDAAGVGLETAFYLLLAFYVVIISRRRGLGTIRDDFGFELRWIDLPLGIGLALVAQVSIGIAADIAVRILGLPPVSGGNVTLPHSRIWAVIDGLAIVSFVGPIVEELFFRGLLLRSIRNIVIRSSRRGGEATVRRARWVSIAVSATVFAAMHLYEATSATELVELAISVLMFGLIAGWIATRTGRLGPSIIAHILNNTMVTVALLSVHS